MPGYGPLYSASTLTRRCLSLTGRALRDRPARSARTELYWLVRKDLLRFFADRNGAMLTIFMPVILGMLLGMLFAPKSSSQLVHLLVIDEDQTEQSQALVTALQNHDAIKVEASDRETARNLLKTGDRKLALILPKGTGPKLTLMALFSGQKMDVPLWYDPSASAEADIATVLIMQVTMQEVGASFADPSTLTESFGSLDALVALDPNGSPELRTFLQAGMKWTASTATSDPKGEQKAVEDGTAPPRDNEKESAAAPGFSPPLALKKEPIVASTRPIKYNSYAHNFAGALCMFILFWALDAAKELIVERDRGVEARVRLTPCPMWIVLLARAISTTLVGLLIALAVYSAAMGHLAYKYTEAGWLCVGAALHNRQRGWFRDTTGRPWGQRTANPKHWNLPGTHLQLCRRGLVSILPHAGLDANHWLCPAHLLGHRWPRSDDMAWTTTQPCALTCLALLGMGGLAAIIGIRAYRRG